MSRRGRWLLATIALAALLALAALTLVGRVMEPERLTPILLRQASTMLGLELRLREPAEYALRPEPRLLLRGLEAFEPGEPEPIAVFERVELSLPWTTLRGRALAIHRIDVEGAVVDVPRTRGWLAAWLDARPVADVQAALPTLTRGLDIRNSELRARDWRIDDLDLDLDRFERGRSSALAAHGTLHALERTLPFGLSAESTLDRDRQGTRLGISTLSLDLQDGTGAGATHYALSLADADARLHQAGWSMLARRLDLVASPDNPDAHLRLRVDSPDVGSEDGKLRLAPVDFELDGGAVVPATRGIGSLRLESGELALAIVGRIQQWPTGWPTLPEPLASNPSALDVEIGYVGRAALQDPIDVSARRDGAAVCGRFELRELLAWRLAETGSPMPPFRGELQADELEFEGTRLRGVRLRLGEEGGERP